VPDPRFPSLAEPAPHRARRTARGTVLRWLMRGIVGALLLVLIGQLIRGGWNQGEARQAKPGSGESVFAAAEHSQPRAWEQSVVAIQSRERTEHQSHGSGFVVGDTGLIATSLHVSASCTEAIVRFADGTTYEVAGYAAVDSQHDLALLKVKDAPATLTGLRFNDNADPPQRTRIWAVGHPEGIEFTVSPGEVQRVLSTSNLPAESQRFLQELTGLTSEETKWIQHSARIAPGSSGGPLVDARGRVLGVNTWVDQSARLNYALHGV
jgi:S1-C subfamily serine protease